MIEYYTGDEFPTIAGWGIVEFKKGPTEIGELSLLQIGAVGVYRLEIPEGHGREPETQLFSPTIVERVRLVSENVAKAELHLRSEKRKATRVA